MFLSREASFRSVNLSTSLPGLTLFFGPLEKHFYNPWLTSQFHSTFYKALPEFSLRPATWRCGPLSFGFHKFTVLYLTIDLEPPPLWGIFSRPPLAFWGEHTKCIYWNNVVEFMKADTKLQRMSNTVYYEMNPVKHFDLLCLISMIQ